MTLANVLEIVERAIDDDAFRELLLTEPEKAVKGARLTRSERAMLVGLRESPYTASPRGLADVRKMVVASIDYGGDDPEGSSPTGAST